MAKRLLNLRHVPDDEAEDIRRFLDENRIDWYETRPSPFGISHGGIWIRDAGEFAKARQLMDAYQRQRAQRAREARAQALEDGSAETFADLFRDDPVKVVLSIVGIVLLLALLLVPAWWLSSR
ncbi:MAG: DUF6164 family protein [Pseudoxanthomonas suwonensis]|nr:DUF6164 family protein [Pseudoxanthomonas suwonensis]